MCSICGQVIQDGDHHQSTTDCIRYLVRRIRTLEVAVHGSGAHWPQPEGTGKGPDDG